MLPLYDSSPPEVSGGLFVFSGLGRGGMDSLDFLNKLLPMLCDQATVTNITEHFVSKGIDSALYVMVRHPHNDSSVQLQMQD